MVFRSPPTNSQREHPQPRGQRSHPLRLRKQVRRRLDRRESIRRLPIHRPSRTNLHRPRQAIIPGRLRRRPANLRSLCQPSCLHHIHDSGRHYDGASNPSRGPHQHGKERVRRNRRLSTRPKRRILPLRYRRDEHRHRRHREEDQETSSRRKKTHTRHVRRLRSTLPSSHQGTRSHTSRTWSEKLLRATSATTTSTTSPAKR